MILVYESLFTILCKISLYYWVEYNLASALRISNNNFFKKRI